MEISYQDIYTRWHHKPVIDGNPSASGNGWLSTAYAKYLAPDTVDKDKLYQCYVDCIATHFPLKINRNPNDPTPPISKDEIIGLLSLGLITDEDLEKLHWNFCNILGYFPKQLSLVRAIDAAIAFYKIRNEEDQHYYWKQKITATFILAFYLAPWHQYYAKKFNSKKTSLFLKTCFLLNYAHTLLFGKKYSKLILWLQLKDLKSKYLIKLTKPEQYMEHDYKPEHPFYKGL